MIYFKCDRRLHAQMLFIYAPSLLSFSDNVTVCHPKRYNPNPVEQEDTREQEEPASKTCEYANVQLNKNILSQNKAKAVIEYANVLAMSVTCYSETC